jgi:hypothetical protein
MWRPAANAEEPPARDFLSCRLLARHACSMEQGCMPRGQPAIMAKRTLPLRGLRHWM